MGDLGRKVYCSVMTYVLDAQTQSDLDLDEVDRRFNLTLTSFGEQVFRSRLMTQPGLEVASARIEEIQRLAADETLARRLEKGLGRLGKQRRGDVFRDLGQGLPYQPDWLKWLGWWFWLGPAATGVLAFSAGPLALLVVLAYLVVNLALYLLTNPKIASWSGSLNYLSRGILLLKRLGKLKQPAFVRLTRYSFLFQDGMASSLTQDLMSMVLDYVRVFLGAELYAYARVSSLFGAHAQEVPELFECLGGLDATLAVVRWMERDPELTHPLFHALTEVQFAGLRHPLVDEGVPQSGRLTRGAIVTGMNMAGKSTFLKSLALNQVLATTLGVVFAKRFVTGNLTVLTSLNLRDDVVAGKSRYFVEAERLLQIQHALAERPLLCLVDEILSGTNTDDRITASLGLLREFGRYPGSLVLAATHDLVIAETLAGVYDPLCFDGDWEEGRLVFDYQPRPGIASRRNALKLLEMLGLKL